MNDNVKGERFKSNSSTKINILYIKLDQSVLF